jgi:hypothetical protein
VAQDYKLIQSQVVSGSSTNTITFDSIPQTYTHLVVLVSARTNTASTRDVMRFRINNDSSAIYNSFFLYGFDSTASVRSESALSNTYFEWTYAVGNNATSNVFGNTTVTLNNYRSTSAVKTVNTLDANENQSTTSWITGITTGYWNSTTAITRLDFVAQSGITYIDGSTFSLYGIG